MTVLLERIRELERKLRAKQQALYEMRRSRDLWRHRATGGRS